MYSSFEVTPSVPAGGPLNGSPAELDQFQSDFGSATTSLMTKGLASAGATAEKVSEHVLTDPGKVHSCLGSGLDNAGCINSFITEATLASVRQVLADPNRLAAMAESNYMLGWRYLSYEMLAEKLEQLRIVHYGS